MYSDKKGKNFFFKHKTSEHTLRYSQKIFCVFLFFIWKYRFFAVMWCVLTIKRDSNGSEKVTRGYCSYAACRTFYSFVRKITTATFLPVKGEQRQSEIALIAADLEVKTFRLEISSGIVKTIFVCTLRKVKYFNTIAVCLAVTVTTWRTVECCFKGFGKPDM